MATNSKYLDIPMSEAQRNYALQSDGMDHMKTTMRTVFGSASLIVSLVAALQVMTQPAAPAWMLVQQTILIALAALYVLLIGLCMAGLWPVFYHTPLPTDWHVLTKTFQHMNAEEMTLMHLSAVIKAVELNRPIAHRYLVIQRLVLLLLPLIVLLALSLAWIPRQ